MRIVKRVEPLPPRRTSPNPQKRAPHDVLVGVVEAHRVGRAPRRRLGLEDGHVGRGDRHGLAQLLLGLAVFWGGVLFFLL
jgi:hypothetical protein